jgi:hypothetical protein
VGAVASLAVAVELVMEDTKVVCIELESPGSSVSLPEKADETPEDESVGLEAGEPDETLPDRGVGSTSSGMATDPT